MARRVIMLRAVNVGGAKLPMTLLREIAGSLGATNISTYIASGNLLCDPPDDPADFDAALEQCIEQQCGFFREAISRSAAELQQALASHPFDVVNPAFSYVSFCRGTPSAEAVAAARQFETGSDQWNIIGDDLHIRYGNGAGRADMPTPRILRALGVPSTARNLNTIRALIDLTQ